MPTVIEVTYGYSLDHREDLKQWMLALLEAVSALRQQLQQSRQTPGIFSADSGLYSAENTTQLNRAGARWVSRVPETSAAAHAIVQGQANREQAAWEKELWHLGNQPFACRPDARVAQSSAGESNTRGVRICWTESGTRNPGIQRVASVTRRTKKAGSCRPPATRERTPESRRTKLAQLAESAHRSGRARVSPAVGRTPPRAASAAMS